MRQIDASVSLPFWDWALDSQNPRASSVFAPDAFGGDGGGPGRNDRCVNDGAFSGWMSNFTNPPSCLERKIDYSPWANSATMGALTGSIDDCKLILNFN